MTSPQIIAFTGPAGSGKSTIAAALERYNFARVRFAGPLKSMLRTLGLTEAQVDGDQKNEPSELLCGRTPRHAMQTLGTEWGRALIGEDVWARAAMHAVDAQLKCGCNVVIDDLRFDNEARALQAFGSAAGVHTIIVALSRAGAGIDGAHASEQPIHKDYITATLPNNTTPGDVVSQLRARTLLS